MKLTQQAREYTRRNKLMFKVTLTAKKSSRTINYPEVQGTGEELVKDAGHEFVADAGGRLSGKHYSSSSARGRGKGREGRGRGGCRNHKDGEEEEQHTAISGKAGGGKVDSVKGNSAKYKRCGETGHTSARCPDHVCGVCGGKGHSAEVCTNVVTVLACANIKCSDDESDAPISGEEEEAFVCDISGEYNNESNGEEGYSALAWQVGNLTAICDSEASCHMPY